MTTNRTSRGAESFDRALNADAATADPSMAKLVALASALVAVPVVAAPAFRDALRTRLMAEAATALPAASVPAASVPAATPSGGLRNILSRPAMQVATGGLAATVAVTGVGVGASRSVPGDTLYGLKRTIERWQVGLAGDHTDEAAALLEHAQTRLDEVRALLDRGALDQVSGALDALNAELKSATDRLLAAARDGSRAAYDELRAALARFETQLRALYGSLPAGARASASAAFATLNVAGARLAAFPAPPVSTKTPSPVPTPTKSGPVITPPPTTVITPPPTSTDITPPPTSILPPPPTETILPPPPTSLLPTVEITLPPFP